LLLRSTEGKPPDGSICTYTTLFLSPYG